MWSSVPCSVSTNSNSHHTSTLNFEYSLVMATLLAHEIEDELYKKYNYLEDVDERKMYRKHHMMLTRNFKVF
jgi:hypothetical protein